MTKYDGRGKSRNKNKLRNLPQYRDMSDEELDKLIEEQGLIKTSGEELDKRIAEKMAKFDEDYDLSDLKINDHEVLRGLIRDIITLEDYDRFLYELRQDGINPDNLIAVDKIQKVVNDLKKSISDAQNDLSITRRHRKSDQEQSVIAYIESLKEKARKFYQSRMSYIFCEKCNTNLATIWTLYSEDERNTISLVCSQKDKDGKPCGHVTTVNTRQLLEKRGTNNRDVMPDGMI